MYLGKEPCRQREQQVQRSCGRTMATTVGIAMNEWGRKGR